MTDQATEKARLQADKSTLLAELGASIYHQYRLGQLYSEELEDYAKRLQKIDDLLHRLREQDELHKTCTCGAVVGESDTYCHACGQTLSFLKQDHQDDACINCGTYLLVGATFCHVCGMRHEEVSS
ncbi:putative OB-fold protein [Alkalibacillus flavidus]|uniref:OB-fold protein n=1 Tax=Alkalibacillus flavidus TaxID=546021 RepID=A0ABV2KXD3_9BACI